MRTTRRLRSAGTIAVVAIAAIGVAVFAPASTRAQSAPLTLDQLRNASYPSELTASGAAPLAHGAYSEPATPGSASTVTVTLVDATIAADFAAVVLASSGGGSGTFYTLHLVSNESGTLAAGAGTPLGDRIVLHELAIEGTAVRVALTTHAANDPLCCPTRDETRLYGFDAGGFRLLSTTPGIAATTPAPSATGAAGLAAPGAASIAVVALLTLAAVALVASARAVVRRRA